ncbi:MAG: DUF3558 domain-containing protein [Pseudonocardiaceae bacterium]|nr:DUF3558 domain-containing protein [Pseudonocardiaceae bacterium]
MCDKPWSTTNRQTRATRMPSSSREITRVTTLRKRRGLRPAALAVLGAVGLLAGVACSASQEGAAAPAVDVSASSSGDSSPKGTDALEDIDACELLTEQEAQQVGFTEPGEPDDVAGNPTCDWRISGEWSVLVGVRANRGVDDLNLSQYDVEPDPITLGRHEAQRGATKERSGCAVWIRVGQSSSVSIGADNSGGVENPKLACERATKVAELVEPKLP